MKFSVIASALALTGGASAMQSICDKYTVALLKNNTASNQLTLVTLLVKTAALGNFTGGSLNPMLPGSLVAVPGILAPGTVNGTKVNLAPYFSGALASTNVNGKAEAINWLDNGSVESLEANVTSAGTPGSHGATLFTHLIEYFGVLLGCSMVGKGAFPAYGGSNDMAAVHQYMQLSAAEVGWFIENVGLAAASFGVSKADITTVADALNSLFGQRCSAPVVVVPGTPKLPQAICQDMTCPLASPADCAAYPMESAPANATATMSAPASIMPATVSMMSTGTAVMSSGMNMSSTTAIMMTSTSSSVPVATGGAAALEMVGAIVAAAPLVAMLL